MTTNPALDDRAVELVLTGRVPAGRADLTDVAHLVGQVRAAGEVPVADLRPNDSLAAVLAGRVAPGRPAPGDASPPGRSQPPTVGLAGSPGATRRRRATGRRHVAAGRRSTASWVGALGLTAKLAAATGAAVAATAGAAAAGVLPGPVQDAAADAVSAVTPFELPRSGDPADRRPVDAGTDDGAAEPVDAERSGEGGRTGGDPGPASEPDDGLDGLDGLAGLDGIGGVDGLDGIENLADLECLDGVEDVGELDGIEDLEELGCLDGIEDLDGVEDLADLEGIDLPLEVDELPEVGSGGQGVPPTAGPENPGDR